MSDNNVTELENELVEDLLQKFEAIGIDTSTWEYEFGDGNSATEFIQAGIKSHLEKPAAIPPTVAEQKEVKDQIEELQKTLQGEWGKALDNKNAAIKAKKMDDAVYWDAYMSRSHSCIIDLKLLLALPLPPTQPADHKSLIESHANT